MAVHGCEKPALNAGDFGLIIQLGIVDHIKRKQRRRRPLLAWETCLDEGPEPVGTDNWDDFMQIIL
jgi:hypothetical protein